MNKVRRRDSSSSVVASLFEQLLAAHWAAAGAAAFSVCKEFTEELERAAATRDPSYPYLDTLKENLEAWLAEGAGTLITAEIKLARAADSVLNYYQLAEALAVSLPPSRKETGRLARAVIKKIAQLEAARLGIEEKTLEKALTKFYQQYAPSTRVKAKKEGKIVSFRTEFAKLLAGRTAEHNIPPEPHRLLDGIPEGEPRKRAAQLLLAAFHETARRRGLRLRELQLIGAPSFFERAAEALKRCAEPVGAEQQGTEQVPLLFLLKELKEIAERLQQLINCKLLISQGERNNEEEKSNVAVQPEPQASKGSLETVGGGTTGADRATELACRQVLRGNSQSC